MFKVGDLIIGNEWSDETYGITNSKALCEVVELVNEPDNVADIEVRAISIVEELDESADRYLGIYFKEADAFDILRFNKKGV